MKIGKVNNTVFQFLMNFMIILHFLQIVNLKLHRLHTIFVYMRQLKQFDMLLNSQRNYNST